MRKYKVLDAFSGAGGLSYGFEKQGCFDIVLAIENDKWAKATYKANHLNTDIQDDITNIDFYDLKKRYPDIDVIIGGPPCQGFSNANRHSTAINLNNLLVKKYVELVRTISPTVFVMENVKMIASNTKRFFLNTDEVKSGFFSKASSVTTIHLPFISSVYFNDSLQNNCLTKQIDDISEIVSIFRSKKKDGNIGLDALKNILCDFFGNSIPKGILISKVKKIDDLEALLDSLSTIYRMYTNKLYIASIQQDHNDFAEIKCLDIKVLDYISTALMGEYDFNIDKSNVFNTADFGVPQERLRYVLIGIKKGTGLIRQELKPIKDFANGHYRTVKDAIFDLETLTPSSCLEEGSFHVNINQKAKKSFPWRDSNEITSHCVTSTKEDSLARFKALKQGENFHNLPFSLVKTYANRERTQNSIYRRLKYDEPSPTVTNVRKSMWIHPTLDRAISIREAARLQSFPDSYRFFGPKDRQYQQIGNAVPPLFAKELASVVAGILNSKHTFSNN